MFGHLQTSVTLTLSNDRICKTLEISLPDRLPEFLHSFRGERGDLQREYSFSLTISTKLLCSHSLMNYLPSISFFQAERKAQNFSEVPRGRLRIWIPGGMGSSKRCGFISLTSL